MEQKWKQKINGLFKNLIKILYTSISINFKKRLKSTKKEKAYMYHLVIFFINLEYYMMLVTIYMV
jgi:hypothetical protein